WNMFDFAADARAEGGENGMNHKGLVTFDRKYKKDSYYAYQAWLSDKPMLHICSKRYVDRVEDTVKIKVYSNCDEVELFANGESVGVQKKGQFPFFTFEVKNIGETVITAKAGDLTDESKIRKVDKFNEDYHMKDESAVINWFEINTPVGYYSVNDTIGDIIKTAKGKLALLRVGVIFLKALKKEIKGNDRPKNKKSKKLEIMGITPSKDTLKMGYGFTVKRVISMLNGKFTKEQILKINEILNKVKKPQ
ncbi:MAG TPA: beta-galactosidase, partial [Ruminococcaceae bacterium]|nr:beta-galactosidase [Oscillospiraceae bacterium]